MLREGAASLAELTDLVYGSVFGECSWQDFLDRLATTLPDGKTAFHYHDFTSHVTRIPYMSGFSREAIDQFTTHFGAADPWTSRSALARVGEGMTCEDLLPRDQVVKTAFYNDWLKPQAGSETSIGVTLIRESRRILVLFACTPSIDMAFNKRAASLYTELSPHLRRAVDFARKGHFIAEGRREGQTLLDAMGTGLIYVSEGRSVRSLNDSAERMIASDAPLRVTVDGRLAFQSHHTTEMLEYLTSRDGPRSGPHVVTIRGSDSIFYRVTMVRLRSDPFAEVLGGPTVAIIAEPNTTALAAPQRAYLAETFKLTPKETRIASGILAGLSLKDMAVADGVSYETVRTHLKNVYAKMQVNSQASLVALLMR